MRSGRVLGRRKWWIFSEALVALGATRIVLWVMPARVRKALLARERGNEPPQETSVRDDSEAKLIAWAVNRASRFVPRATCLTQALAASFLMQRRGIRCSLKIGVAKGAGNQFQAHAWLDLEGRVILGGQESDAFTPLVEIGTRTPMLHRSPKSAEGGR